MYLHHVFDLWARWWRRRFAHGDVIIVRFADDFVAGFEHQEDAQRFLADLRERFAKFGLELHPDKTPYPQAVVAFDLGESVGKDTPPCA